MKRLLNWFRRTFQTRPVSAHRRQTVRPQLEQLDDRLVLSSWGTGSAISIYHPGSWHSSPWGGYYSLPWTERDWYTIDQTTNQLVEFQGTSRHNLGRPPGVNSFLDVSASVDPNTGFGEVFVLASPYAVSTRGPNPLWVCDSYGAWHSLGGLHGHISATRDGHVYATISDGSDVQYLDSQGNGTDLGAPNANGQTGTNNLAASVSWFGHNEVFAVGWDGAIYVNSANAAGQWQLVDSSANFSNFTGSYEVQNFEGLNRISATGNDTLFALTTDGRLIEETEHYQWNGIYGAFYWTHQDISGGRLYQSLSADSDASGQAEVYAIETGTKNAYLYDQGTWTWQDSDVADLSAADGGYFYDVNYARGSYNAYQFNPSADWPWTYLGSRLW
jgi:hypothetical protein